MSLDGASQYKNRPVYGEGVCIFCTVYISSIRVRRYCNRSSDGIMSQRKRVVRRETDLHVEKAAVFYGVRTRKAGSQAAGITKRRPFCI